MQASQKHAKISVSIDMELTQDQQMALSRWHDLGATTPTHPVLQAAYELYIAPLGIVCDALSYDAMAALSEPSLDILISSPVFNPEKVDREWEMFSIIEPLIKISDLAAPAFTTNGSINEFYLIKDISEEVMSSSSGVKPQTDQQRLQEFEDKYANDIFELSRVASKMAKAYIDTCLNLISQPEEISSDFAKVFVMSPKRFAVIAFKAITKQLAH